MDGATEAHVGGWLSACKCLCVVVGDVHAHVEDEGDKEAHDGKGDEEGEHGRNPAVWRQRNLRPVRVHAQRTQAGHRYRPDIQNHVCHKVCPPLRPESDTAGGPDLAHHTLSARTDDKAIEHVAAQDTRHIARRCAKRVTRERVVDDHKGRYLQQPTRTAPLSAATCVCKLTKRLTQTHDLHDDALEKAATRADQPH
jgi:hypothetical protein